MADLAEIERKLGSPPGDPKLRMTPANVTLVRQWLIAQGFDEARISVSREDLLYRAYTKPSAFRQLKGRGDYFPAARKEHQPMWDVKPKPVPPPRPEPIKPEPVAQPDLANQIAAALAPVLAGQGITEYRVYELIQEHVPGLIRQVVAEMFAEFSAAHRED